MNYNRYLAGCTLFMSPLHDYRYVILVAGGIWGNLGATELLDYTDPNATWEESKYTFTQAKKD